jgi:hypothetical protein
VLALAAARVLRAIAHRGLVTASELAPDLDMGYVSRSPKRLHAACAYHGRLKNHVALAGHDHGGQSVSSAV